MQRLTGESVAVLASEASLHATTMPRLLEAALALADVFAELLNSSPEAGGRPRMTRSLLLARSERPALQLRLAHEAYQFESRGCVFVADHDDGQASMDGEHRYADEWHWDLSGVSAACPKIKQATFLCASTAERAWLFPRLQAYALEKFQLTLVPAGRSSIELGLLEGPDPAMTPNKSRAAEILAVHNTDVFATAALDLLVLLDMDGTILPKAPGNTIENNFSKSAAIHEIKHLLERRCPVAVNTGNQALLQIQRILRGFSTADCYLLPRLLLCAQGGTVAYRFEVERLARGQARVTAWLMPEWEGWFASLASDLARVGHLSTKMVIVDDEVGGNEVAIGGANVFRFHVPSEQADVQLVNEDNGMRLIMTHKPHDRGLRAVLSSLKALHRLGALDHQRLDRLFVMELVADRKASSPPAPAPHSTWPEERGNSRRASSPEEMLFRRWRCASNPHSPTVFA